MYRATAARKTPRKQRPKATPQPRLPLRVLYVAVLLGGDILAVYDRPATLRVAGATPNWAISGSSILAGSGVQISRDTIRFSVTTPVTNGQPCYCAAGDPNVLADDLGLSVAQTINFNG